MAAERLMAAFRPPSAPGGQPGPIQQAAQILPANEDPAEFLYGVGSAIMHNPISGYLTDGMRSAGEWLRRHPEIVRPLEQSPLVCQPGEPWWRGSQRFTGSNDARSNPPPADPIPSPPPSTGYPIPEPTKPAPPEGSPQPDPPKPGDNPPKVVRIPLGGFEPFVRDFSDFILEANPHGRGRPGNELTRKGNLTLLKACQDAAADRYYILEHIAGADKPELSLTGPTPNIMKGRSFPDITFDITHQNGRIIRVLLNTVTTLADGTTPDSRERRGLDNLKQNAAAPRNIVKGENLVGDFPKLRAKDGKQVDQETYEREARQYCDGVLDKIERLLLKETLNLSPD
jgi:hypothetical protein